jgi:predicted enzyme related to lactoylglutathione lyase
VGELVYLYAGSADVDADLAFYVDGLGGELVWRFKEMGADVAAVRLGDGPLWLLADHRKAPSVLPIWSVDDIDAAIDGLRAAGWKGSENRVEVPDGPCAVLTDPSGNEIGLLHRVRPDALTARE